MEDLSPDVEQQMQLLRSWTPALRYTCITKCYFNLRLYREGESNIQFPPNVRPNEFFALQTPTGELIPVTGPGREDKLAALEGDAKNMTEAAMLVQEVGLPQAVVDAQVRAQGPRNTLEILNIIRSMAAAKKRGVQMTTAGVPLAEDRHQEASKAEVEYQALVLELELDEDQDRLLKVLDGAKTPAAAVKKLKAYKKSLE